MCVVFLFQSEERGIVFGCVNGMCYQYLSLVSKHLTKNEKCLSKGINHSNTLTKLVRKIKLSNKVEFVNLYLDLSRKTKVLFEEYRLTRAINYCKHDKYPQYKQVVSAIEQYMKEFNMLSQTNKSRFNLVP